MITIFGIPNCDTVKKARIYLSKNNIEYDFIDFKKTPPTLGNIKAWADFLGELPINKKGTTYRKFKDHFETLSAQEKIAFIIANPSIIKRPILEQKGRILLLGFNEEQYNQILLKPE